MDKEDKIFLNTLMFYLEDDFHIRNVRFLVWQKSSVSEDEDWQLFYTLVKWIKSKLQFDVRQISFFVQLIRCDKKNETS